MTIPEAMIEALQESSDIHAGCSECGRDNGINDIGFNNPDEVVQDIINAAWTKFDKEDETTFPDKDQFENDSQYLVLIRSESYGSHISMEFDNFDKLNGEWCGRRSGDVFEVVAYCDPQIFITTEQI